LVLSAAGLLTILVILDGYSEMPLKPPSKPVPVIAIQSNVTINGDWSDPNFEEQFLATLISMSEQAVRSDTNAPEGVKRETTVVIWPESPMNFRYERDPALRERLGEFTKRNQVYLLINSWAYLSENDTSETVFNSAMVIGPSGDRISRYDKIALVPFGEYVPARGLIPFMDRIPALVADVTAGRGDTTVMTAGDTTLGTMICFEATRPEIARRMRRQGASALVQISNEAWFGPTAAPRQFLAHSVFRAVENNIELIRATNSGLSAEISANGYVDGETPIFDRATRKWRVRTAHEGAESDLTFYTRHGDVLAGTCVGISALLGVGAGLSMKWKGRDSEDD
jgi:apolipoprotein N-acyltransferase